MLFTIRLIRSFRLIRVLFHPFRPRSFFSLFLYISPSIVIEKINTTILVPIIEMLLIKMP